jgi:predicted transglutaminase-like cysteine proteinase
MMNKYSIAECINSDVNASVTYKTDLEQYNTDEWWTEAGKFGDCEDYALLKREKLLEKGFTLAQINLVCCYTETQQYHCVLLVDTDKGWYILDNRYDWPTPPTQLPYKWDKALREDGKWYEISF